MGLHQFIEPDAQPPIDPLTPQERLAYNAICEAADQRKPCPVNIDLEVMADYQSCSMGSKLVRRLEQKGFIKVIRYQRFRRVQICATGLWTATHETQRTQRKHVPRGSGSMAGKLAKKARNM